MLDTIIEQKKCTKCEQYFDLSNFYYEASQSRFRSECKNCKNKLNIYYQKNKQGTLNSWLTSTLKDSKYRAKKKGLEHNLTREWILANLPKVCPILGIELCFTGYKYNTPSLDRVNNSKGYTPDNVRIISNRANTLKSNATVEELEAIVMYMKNV